MKKISAVLLLAGLVAPALATPQESVTFNDVESRNRLNIAGNITQTATFTGAYTVRKINISGGPLTDPTAIDSYSREACILITPPGGGLPFIAEPMGGAGDGAGTGDDVGMSIQDGRYTVPIAPVAAAGEWTFQFFELWDDYEADDTANTIWSTITFTLDDEGPAVPAPFNPGVSKSYTDINVTGPLATPSFTDTWNVTSTGSADTIVVRCLGVGTGMNNTANRSGSPNYRTAVRVTPPGRAASAWFRPFGNAPAGQVATSAATGEASIPIPGGVMTNVAGNWLVEVANELGTTTSFMQNMNISLALATPPVSTPFPALVANTWVSATYTFPAAGQVKWYTVTIPADINSASGSALDFDMEGSAVVDAAFALYNSTGARMGYNFNSGTGALPLMSFGKGTRNGPVAGQMGYEGGNTAATPNGAVANVWPVLPAGTYYLGVTNGDDGTTIGPALYNLVATTETNAGSATIRARYIPTVAPETPVNTDLGTIGGSVTQDVDLTVNYFAWYKMTIPADANDTTGKYVDIDTANTPEPLNDTNIAVYDSAGAIKSQNDDILTGWVAANPTGGNSALSFGSGATTRDYSTLNANMPAGDGRDGPLTAGAYYLHVSPCCAGYQANNFWVLNDYVTNPDAAHINLHINTNYSTQCSSADIGVQGGNPGQDRLLNNNDFIVFINLFFANSPAADIGIQGGLPGHDTVWDNNDFIVFINIFFNDTPNCTG